MAIPAWFKSNPGALQTGSSAADQIFTVLLSTSMFVGGAIAMLLDNTVPGERRDVSPWDNTVTCEVRVVLLDNTIQGKERIFMLLDNIVPG